MMFLQGCGGLGKLMPTTEPMIIKFVFPKSVADYQPLVTEFEAKNPEIKIELSSMDPGDINNLRDDENYDVLRWDVSDLNQETEKKFLGLDDLISSSNFPKNDFLKGTLEVLQYEGKQIGIPAGINPYVTFANKKLFEYSGTSLPGNQWTMDDFLSVATSVNKQDVEITDADFSFGFCSNTESFDPLVFTYLFGGKIFDQLPSPTRVTLDDPANIQAVKWYADLRLNYGVLSDPTMISRAFGSRDVNLAIAAKKCALWLGLYSDLRQHEWGQWEVKPVMLPLPKGPAPFTVVYMDGYYVLANSKHPDAAFKWITFLSDKARSSGSMIPARTSILQSNDFEKIVSKDVLAVARGLPTEITVMSPQFGDFRVLGNIVEAYMRAVNTVVEGDTEPDVALKQAQATVSNLIQ